jgi:hypothetical protein
MNQCLPSSKLGTALGSSELGPGLDEHQLVHFTVYRPISLLGERAHTDRQVYTICICIRLR